MYTSLMEHTLDRIRHFYEKENRMPSYEEATKLFGYQSKNAAYARIRKFIEEGYLAKSARGKVIPGPRFHHIKLLGLIEAGFPTPAEENLLDTVTLDEYLVKNKEATFMLQVKGDSMYDAGIREGDMVLVERTREAKSGQIVIAEVDGAWTMKYLRREGKHTYLEPANKKYKPIIPKESLTITAVVKAVIRKY
jgi:SOS regulatory protein LexA